MRLIASVMSAALLVSPAAAQCNHIVHVVEPKTQGTFTGKLEKHVFAGPPNWKDVAAGDRPLPTYILRLPESVCADDGERFANVFEPFDSIHISVSGEGRDSWNWLSTHVGQQVTLTGRIFAAHTAYHFAPLVMLIPADRAPQ
jgi:uncharacterized protein DUF4431